MRIAITGGIASGKSTVLRLLKEAGELVVSADEIAREVTSEPAMARAMRAAVGLPETADRAAIRERIFADPEARARLNAVALPEITRRLQAHPARFHEVPLLIENGRQDDYDEVWVVECRPETRLARLVARYGDEEKARQAMASQLPDDVKRAHADEIISTDGTEAETGARIASLLARIRAESREI